MSVESAAISTTIAEPSAGASCPIFSSWSFGNPEAQLDVSAPTVPWAGERSSHELCDRVGRCLSDGNIQPRDRPAGRLPANRERDRVVGNIDASVATLFEGEAEPRPGQDRAALPSDSYALRGM